MPDRHPDHGLLCELEPVAERLLRRHLSMAKEWMPHEYVPWRLDRDFDTEPWTPDQPRLTGVAQAAFEVNLLTEDNLPSYHHQLLASFGHDGAWNSWSHRWTAEEGRHAVVLRDYLLVTRNIDPVALERGRMATVQQGWMPDKTALGLMAYADLQRLSTKELRAERDRLRRQLNEAPRDRGRELARAAAHRQQAEQVLAAHQQAADRLPPGMLRWLGRSDQPARMPGGLAVATQQANRAHDRERELRQHQQRRDGWLEANAHLGPTYREVARGPGLAATRHRPGG